MPVGFGHSSHPLRFLLLGEKRRFGLLGGAEVRGLDFLFLLVQQPVGAFGVGVELRLRVLALLIPKTVGACGLGVETCVGSLLRGFPLNLGVHDFGGPALLQLHLCAFDFDFPLQLGVFGFGLAAGFDVGEFDAHVELCLGVGELGVGMGFFAFSLRLENGGLGIDLANLLPRLSAFFGLSGLSDHACVRNVDLGLIGSSLVGFAAEELEIFASLSILKLFHVCVVTGTTLGVIPIKSWSGLTFSDQIDLARSGHSLSPLS